MVVSTAQAGIFFKLMRSHVRERHSSKLEDEEFRMLKTFYQKHRDSVKRDSECAGAGGEQADIDIDIDIDVDRNLCDEFDTVDGLDDIRQ